MATTAMKTAPYGSWKSPITSDLIVSQSIALSEVRLDSGIVYWLEGRPQEQGRSVVVSAGAVAEGHIDLTPAPYNVRTRVHEYGGGSWMVADETLYFSNFSDGRLYKQTDHTTEPKPLTPIPSGAPGTWRFADGIIDRSRNRWIGVREDHTNKSAPVNAIVAVDLAGSGSEPGRILADGHDFVSSPRLSPDGSRLIWLAWDHPNMPWNGTTLYLADLDEDGAVAGGALAIAGGQAESIFQPEWSPDGTHIIFISDRSGWWNMHRFEPSDARLESDCAHGCGIRAAAMGVRHVHLCVRRAGPYCLHVFAGRVGKAGASRSRHGYAAVNRDAVHAIRLGSGLTATRSCSLPGRRLLLRASSSST